VAYSRARLSLLIVLFAVTTSVAASPPHLAAGQTVDVGVLYSVEGELSLEYHGSFEGTAHRVSRTISFYFRKPFCLKLTDSLLGLQVLVTSHRAQMYDPSRPSVIDVDAREIMGSRIMRMLLANLDFSSLLDARKIANATQSFTIDVHRGVPHPDTHDDMWKPQRLDAKQVSCLESGDWVVMTPSPGSMYALFLGLGRLALQVGEDRGIPRRFLYFKREDTRFEKILTVSIPRLEFNQERPASFYECAIPEGVTRYSGTELVVGIVAARFVELWSALRESLARLGRFMAPEGEMDHE